MRNDCNLNLNLNPMAINELNYAMNIKVKEIEMLKEKLKSGIRRESDLINWEIERKREEYWELKRERERLKGEQISIEINGKEFELGNRVNIIKSDDVHVIVECTIIEVENEFIEVITSHGEWQEIIIEDINEINLKESVDNSAHTATHYESP